MMKIVVNPDYADMKDFVGRLPQLWSRGEGDVIFKKRNEVRIFSSHGRDVVVKKFKPLGLLKSLIYSFFRSTKAARGYTYGSAYLRRCLPTPDVAGYAEVRRWGMVRDAYLITAKAEGKAVMDIVFPQGDYEYPLTDSGRDALQAVGRTVALMHEAGVILADPNLGNFIYSPDGKVAIIDINRTTFHKSVDYQQRIDNLKRVCYRHDILLEVLKGYSDATSLPFDVLKDDTLLALHKYALYMMHKQQWKQRLGLAKKS